MLDPKWVLQSVRVHQTQAVRVVDGSCFCQGIHVCLDLSCQDRTVKVRALNLSGRFCDGTLHLTQDSEQKLRKNVMLEGVRATDVLPSVAEQIASSIFACSSAAVA